MDLDFATKRDFVLTEIIETEKSYVEDIEVIIYDYMRPAEEAPPGTISTTMGAAGVKAFLSTVFSNIEDVHYFAYYFSQKLAEWSPDVGQCFLSLRTEFGVYLTYCTNFKDAADELEKVRSKDDGIHEWLVEQQKISGKGLGLEAYLLKPLQRFLKYPLLLKELLKCTPADSEDYEHISSAYAEIQGLAVHVNEAQREREQLAQLMDDIEGIPPRFRNGCLGSLQLEGESVEYDGGKKKTRHLLLFERALVICKHQSSFLSTHSNRKRLLFRYSMDICKLQIRDLKFPEHSWECTHKGDTHVFSHYTAQENEKWLSLVMVEIVKANFRPELSGKRKRQSAGLSVRHSTFGWSNESNSLYASPLPSRTSSALDLPESEQSSFSSDSEGEDSVMSISETSDAVDTGDQLKEWLANATYEELYEEFHRNQEEREVEYNLRMAASELLEKSTEFAQDGEKANALYNDIADKDEYIYSLDSRIDKLLARMEEINTNREIDAIDDVGESESNILLDSDAAKTESVAEPSLSALVEIPAEPMDVTEIDMQSDQDDLPLPVEPEPGSKLEAEDSFLSENLQRQNNCMVGDVMYSFNAADETELSVTEGDQVEILQMNDSEGHTDWLLCQITRYGGKIVAGYVPASYVNVSTGASEVDVSGVEDVELPEECRDIGLSPQQRSPFMNHEEKTAEQPTTIATSTAVNVVSIPVPPISPVHMEVERTLPPVDFKTELALATATKIAKNPPPMPVPQESPRNKSSSEEQSSSPPVQRQETFKSLPIPVSKVKKHTPPPPTVKSFPNPVSKAKKHTPPPPTVTSSKVEVNKLKEDSTLEAVVKDKSKSNKIIESLEQLLVVYRTQPSMGGEGAREDTERQLLEEQAVANELDYCIKQANATGICPIPRSKTLTRQKPERYEKPQKPPMYEEEKRAKIEQRKTTLANQNIAREHDRRILMDRKRKENKQREANRQKLKQLMLDKQKKEAETKLKQEYKEQMDGLDKLNILASSMIETRKQGNTPIENRTPVGSRSGSSLSLDIPVDIVSQKGGSEISSKLVEQIAKLREAQEKKSKPGAAPVRIRKVHQTQKKPKVPMRRVAPAASKAQIDQQRQRKHMVPIRPRSAESLIVRPQHDPSPSQQSPTSTRTAIVPLTMGSTTKPGSSIPSRLDLPIERTPNVHSSTSPPPTAPRIGAYKRPPIAPRTGVYSRSGLPRMTGRASSANDIMSRRSELTRRSSSPPDSLVSSKK
eukprot:CFRG5402T1